MNDVYREKYKNKYILEIALKMHPNISFLLSYCIVIKTFIHFSQHKMLLKDTMHKCFQFKEL